MFDWVVVSNSIGEQMIRKIPDMFCNVVGTMAEDHFVFVGQAHNELGSRGKSEVGLWSGLGGKAKSVGTDRFLHAMLFDNGGNCSFHFGIQVHRLR